MTLPFWKAVYTHSWIGQFMPLVNRWWVHSQTFRAAERLWEFLQTSFVHSKVNGYFQSNRLGISKVIRQSLLLNQMNRLIFHAVSWLNRFTHSIFDGSLTVRLLHSFHQDASTNPVRYLASFFFSGFVIWVILMLLFGSGFSKNEMTVILLLAFLTWFLSLLEINTVQAIRNSRFFQWFCSWYYSPDETDQVNL